MFYFTRCGQKDASVGQIGGKCSYVVKVSLSELYPIYKDPLKLSYPPSLEEYKKIRQEKTGKATYYPVNSFEAVATMGELGYNIKGFIYPQGGNMNNLIAILWTKEPTQKREDDFYQKEEL